MQKLHMSHFLEVYAQQPIEDEVQITSRKASNIKTRSTMLRTLTAIVGDHDFGVVIEGCRKCEQVDGR